MKYSQVPQAVYVFTVPTKDILFYFLRREGSILKSEHDYLLY